MNLPEGDQDFWYMGIPDMLHSSSLLMSTALLMIDLQREGVGAQGKNHNFSRDWVPYHCEWRHCFVRRKH